MFPENVFILLKPSLEAGQTGTPRCPTSWLAWLASFQLAYQPAGQQASVPGSPQLGKKHICKKTETNCSVLPEVPPHLGSVPAWDTTKCQEPRIFHRTEIPFAGQF